MFQLLKELKETSLKSNEVELYKTIKSLNKNIGG